MKLGAEPKKVGIFAGLLVVAGIVYWMNSADTPTATSAARPAAELAPPTAVEGIAKVAPRRIDKGRASIADNVYRLPNSLDPSKVDPTLRLDLLAKVQSVDLEGGARNLFQFTDAPPPPKALVANVPVLGPLHPNAPPPVASTPAPPAPPPGPPPVPPINLKYYGYSTKRSDGERKAFFLDGEDIIVASEGEIIKKQYKVVRISGASVQMEDTTSKTTQTLPIQPDAAPV